MIINGGESIKYNSSKSLYLSDKIRLRTKKIKDGIFTRYNFKNNEK